MIPFFSVNVYMTHLVLLRSIQKMSFKFLKQLLMKDNGFLSARRC